MNLRTRAPFLLAGIIILMLALSLHSLTLYRQRLENSLSQKIQTEMEQATKQSILLFSSMLRDHFTQLNTVALFCAVNPDEDQVTRLIESCNEGSHYMRLGVAGPDGILYTGDGIQRDISGNAYFQRAMAGEQVISDVFRSEETGADVIALAGPIEREGRVVGMVCARYDVDMFTQLLSTSQFDGQGATLVMQKNGKMVSSYAGMENFGTFYDALTPMEFRGAATLENFRRRVQHGESGFFSYYRNGKERYLYFSPTGVNDYVMISLVMADAMDRQLSEISRQAFALVMKNVLLYSVILICCWGISATVREIIRCNQRDQLTQVYNKAGVRSMVEQLLRRQLDSRHACLFVDLDNFKYVNDCYGHEAGDRLLQNVTEILTDSFRKTDIVGRFGGDEFIVWMTGAKVEHAVKKALALQKAMGTVGGIPVSASIGIAAYPEHGRSYSEVLHNADSALYAAKKAGKNTYSIYTPEGGIKEEN